MSVLIQNMWGIGEHVRMCACAYVASQQKDEIGASPLLTAALIYLDAYDVILSGGLPCQA